MHYQPKQDLLEQRIILVTGAGDGIGREAGMTYALRRLSWCCWGHREQTAGGTNKRSRPRAAPGPGGDAGLAARHSEQCRQIADDLASQIPP